MTQKNHQSEGAYSHVNIGFRVFGAHAQIIKNAALAKGKTVAAYSREIVISWAASDLGLPAPELAAYEYSDVVAEAAKKHGISARAYMLRTAKEAAARELGIPAPIGPLTSADSGTRRAVGSRDRR